MVTYQIGRRLRRFGWGLGGVALWLAIYLFGGTGVAQAQTPAIRYAIGQALFPPAAVLPGEAVGLSVVITNTGVVPITSLPLTDTFDSHYLTLISASFSPDSDNGAGQLRWNDIVASCAGGTLVPGQTCTLFLNFTAQADTSALPNQQTSNTVQSGNQQSRADVRIDAALIRYTLDQRAERSSVAPGVPISFTVTVRNTGGGVMSSLPLTYTYDSQRLLFSSATPPSDKSSPGLLRWNNWLTSCGGTLAPQATCRTVISFVALAQLGYANNIAASGNQQSFGSVAIAAPTQPPPPFEQRPVWTPGAGSSLAWGDVDGDGDLDLAVGYQMVRAGEIVGAPVWVYLNQNGHLQTEVDQPWHSTDTNNVGALAWGDMDNDGDLDLVVGNHGQDKIYRNENGRLLPSPAWTATDNDDTTSLALGDMDGDGDLDLVNGNSGLNQIFLFTHDAQGHLAATLGWQTTIPSYTSAVAIGDADLDGDLDLAVGAGWPGVNDVPPSALQIYQLRKNAQGTLATQQQTTLATGEILSLAWADVDVDGDLDLAVGADYLGPRLFLNQTTNQQLALTQAWTGEPGITTGVAWGDVDNNGRLDLVALDHVDDWGGSVTAKVYLNQPDPQTGESWQLPTSSIAVGQRGTRQFNPALGDVDGDGDLDLALLDGGKAMLLLNRGDDGRFQPAQPAYAQLPAFATPSAVAWGDVNGDGALDLATASRNPTLYLNQAGQLTQTWQVASVSDAHQLAWGDVDGDGDLDLAVGTDSQEQLYLNQGGQLAETPAWQSAEADLTSGLAWGDLDDDGDLDLVVSNATDLYQSPQMVGQLKVYRNQQGQLRQTPNWVSNDSANKQSLALGDVDGDGDLDLAVGNAGAPNQLYRNHGLDVQGNLHLSLEWQAAAAENTHSVAWGDGDGDGDLDLAVGNWGGPEAIYLNSNGVLAASPAWHSIDVDDTWAIAWGDADGDGDLDLATVNNTGLVRVYPNQDGALQTSLERVWQRQDGCEPSSVAWGDGDGDGRLDLALGNFGNCSPVLYRNPAFVGLQQSSAQPEAIVIAPTQAPANFYAIPGIASDGVIPITYTLFSPTSTPMQQMRAFYSPDGGGRWYPAVATSATITQNLASGPFPAHTATNTHVFNWDVVRSGFFGQSDNLVVRIVAIPARKPTPNSVAGPYQRAQVAAQTYPFRVRGSQVRVLDSSAGNPQPAADALVYRLPAGQSGVAQPIRPGTNGAAYSTDGQGYLQGRGQLAIGDRLVALAPITATEFYTLYHLSAAPTLTGLAFYTVTTSGVQTLTVSAAHPLLLFNLVVALEWDAREDAAFLKQLEFDLRRTAEILFDATDGQATLGEITLLHNKEHWKDADIRIYASNALIPNADPGGIVRSEVNDVITNNPFIGATAPYSVTYQPGRIRIGAVWNRFGEATGTLGEDWPRTLAHELGHYAFYLYDNYLGLRNGVIVPVESCQQSLMTDQYREEFSEFRSVAGWAADCAQTVSAQTTGRADWQTITHFYPWLRAPAAEPQPGPDTLPLAVTQVQPDFLPSDLTPLKVAIFELVDGNGKAKQVGPHAQAVLYTADDRLIDLGHPVVDKVVARGAHLGDRLCVYDLLEEQLGCKAIHDTNTFLTMVAKPDWSPEIVVSPVTSRTVSVLVSNVAAGLRLQGKLYPENSPITPATAALDFTPWPGNSYSTTFVLAAGVLAGHIQIWVAEADSPQNPRRESLTSYALGGSPGKLKKPPKGNKRSLDLAEQSSSQQATPAIAPDGQVLIYGNVSFSDGEFYALQKVNQLPATPLWTTVVGDGYRILRSAKAPDLVNTSILFRYRGQDVPGGEERFLQLYFWDEPNTQWRKLPTVINRAVNEASAQAPGPGLYVLMSSLEIPLRQAGWNLVAYPVQQTRPVSQALASLAGSYALVYGYVVTDTVDPWKLYAPDAPTYVNDLQTLSFGQGYWINATQPMTWLVKGPDDDKLYAAATAGLPTPPATFYGAVLPGRGLTPAAGQPVQALINGVVCGQSQTQLFNGQLVYSLNVVGDGARNPACRGAGQQVVITVAGLPLEEARWQNDVAQQVVINGAKLFLPSIGRQPTPTVPPGVTTGAKIFLPRIGRGR